MIYLTRRERFSAAHRMFREDWDEQENYRVFGKCSNPNWHGHNYELYVTVRGETDSEKGFVMNLAELKQILQELIISKLDHKNINLEVPFMQGRIATTENLVTAIWNELLPHIRARGVELHCVKISETENNFVEYYG
ncbi:MAG: 6-carboxytetrahydropterin synthase [Bacteroidales bacterium]|jgi:6-pyruvoyltetrahydropterin/6-carboxytetrahydropterin synthase|nr:6-carboxytetrahydropterin synthase [Bacteroidales bacterium]